MPKSTHHVIYLPGIGDYRSLGQRQVVVLWRLRGLIVHYHKIGWRDGEDFAPKLKRVLAYIDQLIATGQPVSIVGVSAGAGPALQAFAARHDNISKVVLVCGKVHHPETVAPAVYERNPAFYQSAYKVERALEELDSAARARILSIHPLADQSVPIGDTIIDAAGSTTIPTRGHLPSIAYAITLGVGRISRFLKR